PGLTLARLGLGVLGAIQEISMDGGADQVDDSEHIQQVLAVPRPDDRPVSLDPQRGGEGRHHQKPRLVLAQPGQVARFRPFLRSGISSRALACLAGSPRRNRYVGRYGRMPCLAPNACMADLPTRMPLVLNKWSASSA